AYLVTAECGLGRRAPQLRRSASPGDDPRTPDSAPTATVVSDMTAESPRGRELAKLVADHRLGDKHRNVLAAVVNGDRVAEHLRNDHGATRPRLDHVLAALIFLVVHFFLQLFVDEWALLQSTRHRFFLLPFLLCFFL